MNYLKIKKSILASFSILCVLFLMSSCQKDEVIPNEQVSSGIEPTAVNGVFQFRDVEHFEQYYNDMNTLYDENDEMFNSLTEGYRGVETVQYKLENETFTDFKDSYKPFLIDPIMMAIVNTDMEFQIGSDLLTFLNDDYMVLADVNDEELRQKIQAIEKGKNLNYLAIPKEAKITNDHSFEELLDANEIKRNNLMEFCQNLSKKTDSGCTQDYKEKFHWDQEPSPSSYRVAMKTRVANYYSWGHTKEEAKLWGYEKTTAKPYWRNVDLFLEATIITTRRNEDCIVDDEAEYYENNGYSEAEIKQCDSCKNKRARVNCSGKKYHADHEVIGQFRVRINTATRLFKIRSFEY